MKIIQENKKNIKEIITALKNGAVLVLPTDTVYGLVCDATNNEAVKKVFKIKNRNKLKPLGVFIKDIKQAKKDAFVDKKQEDFLKKNWPGAVTTILMAKQGLSPLVYKNNTIGLRVADYNFLNLILENFKKPLAQTSANISGSPATTKIREVIKQFEGKKNKPDIIIDAGNLSRQQSRRGSTTKSGPNNKPSKIIDLTEGGSRVLRY